MRQNHCRTFSAIPPREPSTLSYGPCLLVSVHYLWYLHFQSTRLLDSTNALSHDFAHLSVDDPDPFLGDIDLPRVQLERDTLTDDDHKALDAKISTTFRSDRRHNEEPNLSSLLFYITHNDKRLKPITEDEAE